jgi:arsenite methyltransferase
MLHSIRDRLLDKASLQAGDVVLDAGCGDGLIGFGALERLGPEGRVIFSDISAALLEVCREIATETGEAGLCEFVEASATDLSGIGDGCVDVVTTRSVLIYVSDKLAAFREFYRVLRPGGRVSLFEPINVYDRRLGFDRPFLAASYGGEIAEIGRRLDDYYARLQPVDSDPMLDFDERDLLRLASEAGFDQVTLELQASVSPMPPARWETYLSAPWNPTVPPLKDAIAELLTAEEAALWEKHHRPVVEAGGRRFVSAAALLSARKD